jgi:hypothetical protein
MVFIAEFILNGQPICHPIYTTDDDDVNDNDAERHGPVNRNVASCSGDPDIITDIITK